MRLTLLSVMLTASIVAATHSALSAQTKTIPGDETTITATVEAIDANTRTLTVKGPGGNLVPITVSKAVERFNEIKVGDTITARYYDNIVIRLKPAGRYAANHHGHDRRHRQQGALHLVQGRDGELDVLVARRGQGSPGQSQSRRSGRHHVDRGVEPVREAGEQGLRRRQWQRGDGVMH